MRFLTGTIHKLRTDPGSNFSLADTLLFAQIPNLAASVPAASIAAYIFVRSAASGRLAAALERIEAPAVRAFSVLHPHVPFLNRIEAGEFAKTRPGSTLLAAGVAQTVIFAGTIGVAAANPHALLGWLASAAAGSFAGSNIKFGLQLNDPRRIKADKTWVDVLTSPQFLVAMGSCCSGLMAGLATSFGPLATVPVAAALGSAALVCTGKIGRMRLNTGVPMGILTAVACLNAGVGFGNELLLAAFTNVFSANGERILTRHFNNAYQETRPRGSNAGAFRRAARLVFYRERQQALRPAAKPNAAARFDR